MARIEPIRSFGVTLGLPGGQLLVLENLPVVDSALVEHLRAALVTDLGLGVLVRRVTLREEGRGKGTCINGEFARGGGGRQGGLE